MDARHKAGHDVRSDQLAIATAVSVMRLEKPHSLSYQDMHAHELAVHDLGLIHVEDDECGVVIEVDRDVRLVGDSRGCP